MVVRNDTLECFDSDTDSDPDTDETYLEKLGMREP
jgi:hypothetical protein